MPKKELEVKTTTAEGKDQQDDSKLPNLDAGEPPASAQNVAGSQMASTPNLNMSVP